MALRIGGIPVLLSPTDLAGGIRAVLGWTDEAVHLVADLPARVDRLLTEAEALMVQMRDLTQKVDEVVMESAATVAQADEAVAGAATAVADATRVLAVYQPIVDKAAPMARTFVEEFSAEELHAAIRMVDAIPRLTEHVESDILPLLATLDHVGPDLRELISVVTDVRNALASTPGLRRLLPRRDEPRPEKP